MRIYGSLMQLVGPLGEINFELVTKPLIFFDPARKAIAGLAMRTWSASSNLNLHQRERAMSGRFHDLHRACPGVRQSRACGLP